MIEDFEIRYRAVRSREFHFDDWFFIAVTSIGIYRRSNCPVRTPKRANVCVYPGERW
jgi:AraC family transcriptional regulator of adaptative response / DNA-3-methyladenine glycosylase II